MTCSSRMWQVLISKRDKRLHRPRALNAGQGGGRQTISQNNLFVLTTVTLATRTVPAPFDAGITAPLCLDRQPVLQGLAECPIWKLTAPISPLPLAPQHLQRAERGAMREQVPRTTAPGTSTCLCPTPNVDSSSPGTASGRKPATCPLPILSRGTLPRPPPRGHRGPCRGGVSLRELPYTLPPHLQA